MSNNQHHLWHFHGGLKLPGHKAMSTGSPVARATLPAQLVVPVQQHIGEPGRLLVEPGERVLKGQMLSQADEYVSAAIHAPTSGTISAIEERPIPHPSGLSALCVVIEADGEDQWVELKPLQQPREKSPTELRQLIRQAGIVGLGGATFPTAVKVNPGRGRRLTH